MQRSEKRILTTHVGNLPAAEGGAVEEAAVRWVVERQREAGIDVINEGEYTKGGDWLSFTDDRFGGFTEAAPPVPSMFARGKDQEEFAGFYAWAAAQGRLFYRAGDETPQPRKYWECTGPVKYTGEEALAQEIALLRAAAGPGQEVFLTSTAPASLEVYRGNKHYATEEEYLYALADALRVEYRAIADAGVILQVDDAWLPALWDRIGIEMGKEAFLRRCHVRVEALNFALRGIPEERVRYHMCWGSWHGPHAFDMELNDMAGVLLEVRAGAYLIEAANVRHEHEYAVWERVKLPEGKILIPGVVTHATDLVEHPELVALRIQRFAERVGKENVIASTDCGLGLRLHPQVAWAKLRALSEGARLASATLY